MLYLRIHLLKCEHLGTIASSPWPDAVGLVMAVTSACHVERSFGKHLLLLYDKVVDKVGCGLRLFLIAFLWTYEK